VLSQVQSFTGDDFLSTRQRQVDGSGFELALQAEEARNGGTPTAAETVGWLALDQGVGGTGAGELEAGTTGPAVANGWWPLAFDPAIDGTTTGQGDLRAFVFDRSGTSFDPLLDTYIAVQQGDIDQAAWEYALPAGLYHVTVAVGDPTEFGSLQWINAEGTPLLPGFVPDGDLPFALADGIIEVTDGALTIDAEGGIDTRLSHISIVEVQPDQPQFTDVVAGGREILNLALDVDPNAPFGIGVTIEQPEDAIFEFTVTTDTVRLYRTLDGIPIEGSVNTSGGRDSISFTPFDPLEPGTPYTLVVDGVTTEGREPFVPLMRTFVTGTADGDQPVQDPAIDFLKADVAAAGPLTSLAMGPNQEHLYGATVDGQVLRWDIDPITGLLSNEQQFTGIAEGPDGSRTIIGLAFDPLDPNKLWVSHSAPVFAATPADFTGKISYLELDGGSDFTATITDYVHGLPRSVRDHLTNSLSFGPDGELYVTQGSNSSTGAPDSAWGNRPERLLTAAVLQIDPDRVAPAGGFDVQTGPLPGDDPDATYYDPFATDAPVKLYATGTRNAYDHVWHSSGNLFVPNNGAAAGGNTPDDPSTPADESLVNVGTQGDFLYRVEEGGYYGHPNPTRGEYVLNGGNPNVREDPAEVAPSTSRAGYSVGQEPDPNYRFFAYDFGFKRSPNGIIEYGSGSFDGRLQNALVVAEYSGGDRLLGLRLDADGNIVEDFIVASRFDNPLDVVEHGPSGRLYVSQFGNELDPTDDVITLLTPNTGGGDTPGGEIAIVNPARIPDDDRLVFNEHETLDAEFPDTRMLDTGVIEIRNVGASDLVITDLAFDNPAFRLEKPFPGIITLAPGQSTDVTVRFDSTGAGSTSYHLEEGNLFINSTDPDNPTRTVELAGVWMEAPESNNEATVRDLLDVFGYRPTLTYPGETLRNDGKIEVVGDEARVVVDGQEVPAFYWQRADPSTPVNVEVIAAFHGQGEATRLQIYDYDYDPARGAINETAAFINERRVLGVQHDGRDAQSLLPRKIDTELPAEFSVDIDGPLAFHINGRWSDANKNFEDSHVFRLFPMVGNDGNVEPNKYIGLFDFIGNYDYQDFIFIASNIEPFAGDDVLIG
jgi:hypothetical protein